MSATRAAIVGTGYAVPPTVRTNDDPIFDYIKANDPTHGELFFGYVERRVLGRDEQIEPYMVQAAHAALADAGKVAGDIDLLLGFSSISQYLTPNALTRVHAALGLAPTCWMLPVHADYSNYSASLLIADAMVTARRATNVLIVCGSNWTQNVSYLTPPCVSIGDGAAAAVVAASADPSLFRVVDFEVDVESSGYGGMFTSADPMPDPEKRGPHGSPWNHAFSSPYFHLTDQGVTEFKVFGKEAPPTVIEALLRRNALSASQVAMVCYQASAGLIDAWVAALKPQQCLHTITQFANMVTASIGVNFAYHMKAIATNHIVLLTLGAEPHAAALLLRRNE